ncbi:MAG: hypothetical protein KDJ16_04325 [Hyphomicrobiales bacterium]|nr:hypothetical protein [Hyphomicrobiales bacterium]
MTILSFAAFAAMAFGLVSADRAQAESPFHTGVWQLNTPQGPVGLVASDWLVFENGLPSRWLYRKAGTNLENQFNYYIRTIGQSNYAAAVVTVHRTDDNSMQYTLAEKGREPITYPAVRLSVPNYAGSCLSVENKGERLLGRWTGTKASSFKRLQLSKTKLTIDGNSMAVDVREVRVAADREVETPRRVGGAWLGHREAGRVGARVDLGDEQPLDRSNSRLVQIVSGVFGRQDAAALTLFAGTGDGVELSVEHVEVVGRERTVQVAQVPVRARDEKETRLIPFLRRERDRGGEMKAAGRRRRAPALARDERDGEQPEGAKLQRISHGGAP